VNSLLPVLDGGGPRKEVALVIPVDPFRGYLEDLARALHEGKGDLTLSRPDLIVVGIVLGETRVRIHVTPVEVKSRLSSTFSASEAQDALGQAKALASLLQRLSAEKEPLTAWRLAYQHLLLTIIGFGMRVYSQHQDLGGQLGEWAGFHERIAAAILDETDSISVDERGRLIVMDGSPLSEPRDYDRDGFDETIVIGLNDAGRIVAKDAAIFYDSVRAKVGDWQLRPSDGDGKEGKAKPTTPDQGSPSAKAGPKGPGREQADVDAAEDKACVAIEPPTASGNGIRLAVGRSERSFEAREFSLSISDTRMNQLNMGVVGDLGTGKTQLLKSLVYQIVSSAGENRGSARINPEKEDE
jgi:DNA phosphorothioation-dependent restriction protein DptH